jgi:hypothetical protein
MALTHSDEEGVNTFHQRGAGRSVAFVNGVGGALTSRT